METRARKRLSKERYYLNIAKAVAQRATCLRRIYGAVVVVNDEIVSTGYCGSPRGAKNCIDLGYCMREELKIPSGERYEKCRSVHAEQNAIISASRREMIGGAIFVWGEDLSNKDPHFRVEPCMLCKKFIINAGLIKAITANSAGDVLRFNVEDWINDEQYLDY